jgi:hypothetical protein
MMPSNIATELTAPTAEAKNPASVTPTCMVARKTPGFSVNLSNALAFLLPSLASFWIRILRTERIAISEAAKKALSHISDMTMSICTIIPASR